MDKKLFNIRRDGLNLHILDIKIKGDIFLLFICGSYFDCIMDIAHVFL